MKITILGCGSSGGVPLIGNNWGACDPKNPRNRRTRVSVLVEQNDTTLLVDLSPDMRQQLLDCNFQKPLTAVLFTHAHADHCHGIDELRSINWMTKKPVDIYANEETIKELERRFPYILRNPRLELRNPRLEGEGPFHAPSAVPHVIKEPFQIGDITVRPFTQDHGYGASLGYRLNDFAYSTDVKNLDEKAFDILKGVKVWVVDCVREIPHPTHSHLEQTLEWIARVKPERAYLTHMNTTMDYDSLRLKLPAGVEPAYDGLVIEC